MNVTWSGDGPCALDSVHISIAVATDRGLITPIIKDAADKGVQEISANIKVKDKPLCYDVLQGDLSVRVSLLPGAFFLILSLLSGNHNFKRRGCSVHHLRWLEVT